MAKLSRKFTKNKKTRPITPLPSRSPRQQKSPDTLPGESPPTGQGPFSGQRTTDANGDTSTPQGAALFPQDFPQDQEPLSAEGPTPTNNEGAPSDPLTAALYYVDRGYFVVPCCPMTPQGQCTYHLTHTSENSIGKVPLFSNWPLVRLTRAEVIDWWTRFPNANVGVLLEPSGLLILDTDSREAQEEALSLGVPPGPQVKTSAEHVHRYYRNPKAIIAATTRQGSSGKIDVLSKGIAIGAGSIHRTGKRYQWLVTFEECPLEDPPPWAEQLLLDAIKTKATAVDLPDALPAVELDDLSLPLGLSEVIRTGQRPNGESVDRSKSVRYVLLALIEAGFDDPTIASLLLNPRYAISEKPREQGTRWLSGDMGRARAKVAATALQREQKAKGLILPSEPQGGVGEDVSTTREEEVQLQTSDAFGFDTYNGLTLRTTDFPPLQEAIPDLLPIGLTVLAGPPKIGKSFLVLNIACAVAAGGKAFSRFDVKGGGCYYLALEDSPRRMKKRLLSLLGDFEEWPVTLPDITHRAPLSGAGLEELITGWVTTHPGARLVIIDTLAKVKPPRQRGQDPYQEDYQISARLQQLALKHDIAILLVHHTKKGPEEDFLSAVSGTYGVTGGADAVWVLRRKRGQQEGTLSVTGRDIEERDLAMKTEDGDWLCLGDATEVRRSASRQTILEALVPANLTPAEIASVTKMNRATVRQLLMKMLTDGEVFKVAEKYSLLPPQGGE